MATTTFNPSDLSGVTLSNANLTATASSASGGVRAVAGWSITGKFYWEATATQWANASSGIGIADSIAVMATVKNSNDAAMQFQNGVWINGSNPGGVNSGLTTGALVCIAVDVGAKLIWFRIGAAGNWNNSGTANPATGAGGFSFSALGAIVYPVAAFAAINDAWTANFGASAFAGVVPTGFASGVAAASGTTLNPSDKDSHITLSNGNLTATGTVGQLPAVRSTFSASSGKYYFEFTCTTFTQAGSGVGVALGSAVLNSGDNVVGACALDQLGTVWLNGSTTSVVFGAIPSGTVVGVALDVGANLIWFRLGATGNWNASSTANPATGVGGTTALGSGAIYYAWAAVANANVITANFGASGFVGAVPSGFTSGFLIPPKELAATWALNVAVGLGYAPSLYGSGLYGVHFYGHGTSLTPDVSLSLQEALADTWSLNLTFTGDLNVTAFAQPTDELAGSLSPQINFSATLSVDAALAGAWALEIESSASMTLQETLGGAWSLSVVIKAPDDLKVVVAPLWGNVEPCPTMLWTPMGPCPPAGWFKTTGNYQPNYYGLGLYGNDLYSRGDYGDDVVSPWVPAQLCGG